MCLLEAQREEGESHIEKEGKGKGRKEMGEEGCPPGLGVVVVVLAVMEGCRGAVTLVTLSPSCTNLSTNMSTSLSFFFSLRALPPPALCGRLTQQDHSSTHQQQWKTRNVYTACECRITAICFISTPIFGVWSNTILLDV